MKIFLAGIMQGSHLGALLHNQDYRARIKTLLEAHLPAADVYDPLADHQDSLDYDEERGRSVFMHHNQLCTQVDLLLAFVPQASMGTAIEMWEAHRHGRVVLTISPLEHNWAVKHLSHQVYADLAAFEAALAGGQVLDMIQQIQSRS